MPGFARPVKPFDTVDHDILVERLSRSQGMSDDALKLIKSYLTGRTKSVNALDHTSETAL